MAAIMPFCPNMGATLGNTVKVVADATPASVSGSLTSTNKYAPSILVTNAGTTSGGTGTIVFVRVSSQATPTAAATDTPVLLNKSIVIANPVPNGVCGIAVKSISATANDVYFTPGQGGL